jgi:hypothetical protein
MSFNFKSYYIGIQKVLDASVNFHDHFNIDWLAKKLTFGKVTSESTITIRNLMSPIATSK